MQGVAVVRGPERERPARRAREHAQHNAGNAKDQAVAHTHAQAVQGNQGCTPLHPAEAVPDSSQIRLAMLSSSVDPVRAGVL
jgi:hypothetical protein